ncbi:hypothetical protein AURDEDRAFT_154387 [Auricularia subglabra TFB-10046 SS5]|uniref:GED domain-containing protein n=1 Tax=Auricularia subglabra (strain TFB-10046 / SS5) TaxID=717982 RepID=J0WUA1_AURST|nr:hypothetical protein AURDEDRAFT_154387 [Auricularia subglabra TFB-10046 SS5]
MFTVPGKKGSRRSKNSHQVPEATGAAYAWVYGSPRRASPTPLATQRSSPGSLVEILSQRSGSPQNWSWEEPAGPPADGHKGVSAPVRPETPGSVAPSVHLKSPAHAHAERGPTSRIPGFPIVPERFIIPPPIVLRDDIQATLSKRILTNEQPCFRYYRNLREALAPLSPADRTYIGTPVPELVVFEPGTSSGGARVMAALTGVNLCVPTGTPHQVLIWEVALREEATADRLREIEERVFVAMDHGEPNGTRLATCDSVPADLLVYHSTDMYKTESHAIVAVCDGDGREIVSSAAPGPDSAGKRTIVLNLTDDDENWKVQLRKLDDILIDLVRARISETMTRLTSRIDDVRRDLKTLPADHGDAASQLMRLTAEFAADIFGVGATQLGEPSVMQQLQTGYEGVSMEIKDTIPQFIAQAPIAFGTPSGSHPPPQPCLSRSPSPALTAPEIPPAFAAGWGWRAAASPRAKSPPRSRSLRVNTVTFESVSARLLLLRREELPGQFPVNSLCRAMIEEYTRPWADIAEQRLHSIAQTVAHRVSVRLGSVFGPYQVLLAEVLEIMKERIRSAHRVARDAISTLASMETSFIVHDEEAFLVVKERWTRKYSQDFRSHCSSDNRVQALTRAATLDVLATVSTSLELAHQRFLDGVKRAVDAHVIHALDKDILPAIIGALKEREAGKWLEPSSGTAGRRAEVQGRLESLTRAREEVMLCALA